MNREVKSYILSFFLHLFLGTLIFFLTAVPGKELPPVKINQVFLVAEVPTAFVPVGARFIEPAGRINPTPTIKLDENKIGSEPIKPEVSLAEKLAKGLKKAETEDWKPSRQPKNNVSLNEPEKKIVVKEDSKNSPEQTAVSINEGPTQVKSEEGFSDEWYLALLSRRLTERWNPIREGIAVVKREVTISFTITRHGRIKDIILIRSSGNPRFDRSALTAVKESDFLPPLPSGWEKKELKVSVRFRES